MRVFLLFCFAAFMLGSCSSDECREMYQTDCQCADEYIPVCGCNEKTYANECYAQCAGVEFEVGKCP